MRLLESLARVFGGRRDGASSGLMRLRDSLSLVQAAIAVAAVSLAQSASLWAIALTILLATLAMIRPLPEAASRTSQRLWTFGIVVALAASGARALVFDDDLLIAGVDFFLLMVVQRLFNRQRCREHMQLLMLGAVLMVIAAVIDAELHYPVLLILYLPTATLALMVDHLISEGERLGKRVEYEVDRYGRRELSRLSRAAGQVALLAAAAGLFTFFAFPRFGVGVFLRGNLYGNDSVGFSDSVALGGFGTIKSDATVVMHLIPIDEDPEDARLTWHLRGSAFGSYDDGRWTATRDGLPSHLVHRPGYSLLEEHGELPGKIIAPPFRAGGTSGKSIEPRPIPGFAASDQTIRVLVTMEDIGTELLFAAGHPLGFSLTPRGQTGVQWIGASLDDQIRHLDRQPGPIQYEFVSRIGEPTRAELAAIGVGSSSIELAPYIEVALSDEFVALAESITEGADTRLAKVEAIQAYLLDNYEYSLDQPLSDRVRDGEIDPVEGFLFDTKAGHCEYFASAMALLLRAVDVPTRNVNGFYGAHYNSIGEFYAVRQADAHSWVEVYFDGLGWVTFDPTPPAGRTAGDDAPWFPRLAQLTDALRNAYLQYVIDWDLGDQLEVLERLGVEREGWGFKIDWARLTPWIGGAFGLGLISVIAVRLARRRRAPTRPEIEIYAKLLALMHRRGRARLEHESARAWAARLDREGAAEAGLVGEFAAVYEPLRFGPGESDGRHASELARLRALVRRVKAT